MTGHHKSLQKPIYGDGYGPEPRTKRVMLRMEPSMYAMLQAVVKDDFESWKRVTVSELIRHYIMRGLEQDGVKL